MYGDPIFSFDILKALSESYLFLKYLTILSFCLVSNNKMVFFPV